MTREEAARVIEDNLSKVRWNTCDCAFSIALDMAIEALRQESVPLAEVYRLIAGHSDYHGGDILAALTCIAESKAVNPVRPLALRQPERPKGRWVQEIHTGLIGDTNEYNDTYFFRCSICGRTVFEKEPYCHCGADMRDGEEE